MRGCGRLGWVRWSLPPTWLVETGFLKGTLDDSHGWDVRRPVALEHLHADAPSPPAGMLSPEPASKPADGFGIGRRGASTCVVADSQAVGLLIAKGSPEIADRVIRELQFGSDLGQSLAAIAALDDVEACVWWQGARHGVSPLGPQWVYA
jgi:hypothetical protein